jgi:hypothetical protein
MTIKIHKKRKPYNFGFKKQKKACYCSLEEISERVRRRKEKKEMWQGIFFAILASLICFIGLVIGGLTYPY